MASKTENVKLGVCTVFFDGRDLGFTKGGVEAEVQTKTHEVKIDQFGDTPINELITGREVTIKIPLAESTLENIVATMPGATLVSDGVAATGSITFVAVPVNGDKVTIGGKDFTFKTAPTAGNRYELAIPGTVAAAASALADAINAVVNEVGAKAVANAAAVALTALERNTSGNAVTLAKTFATSGNLTLSGATLTGGVAPTRAKVVIPVGTNISLLDTARKLVLRPKGTTGAEDFIVPRAATAGGLSFAYKTEDERVLNTSFKGYPDALGNLIIIGDEAAV